jgi:hypothetical protein
LHTQLPSSINAPLKAASKSLLDRFICSDVIMNTAELEEEEYHHFTDVGMRQVSQMRLHGDIRIGTSHLRITSVKLCSNISSFLKAETLSVEGSDGLLVLVAPDSGYY